MKVLFLALALVLTTVLASGVCSGQVIEVYHADSLAGPMKELKKAFEAERTKVTVKLTSGRSKELSGRILKGDTCDVFVPSDPAVVKEMFGKKINDKDAASWYVVFSSNEMVVITGRGNPLAIKKMSDLSLEEVRVVRVIGENDLATKRTLDFIRNATEAEGKPELSRKIIDATAIKANTVPEAVQAIKEGRADAGIVYLSAAIASGREEDIVYFPTNVNLSRTIRNALTVPGTAVNVEVANDFVKFILSTEGQRILKKTGQPPIIPPLYIGDIPPSIGLR